MNRTERKQIPGLGEESEEGYGGGTEEISYVTDCSGLNMYLFFYFEDLYSTCLFPYYII